MSKLNSRLARLEQQIAEQGWFCAACQSIPFGVVVYSEAECAAFVSRLRAARARCTCGRAGTLHVRITCLHLPHAETP
jgi:hypothetical protein